MAIMTDDEAALARSALTKTAADDAMKGKEPVISIPHIRMARKEQHSERRSRVTRSRKGTARAAPPLKGSVASAVATDATKVNQRHKHLKPTGSKGVRRMPSPDSRMHGGGEPADEGVVSIIDSSGDDSDGHDGLADGSDGPDGRDDGDGRCQAHGVTIVPGGITILPQTKVKDEKKKILAHHSDRLSEALADTVNEANIALPLETVRHSIKCLKQRHLKQRHPKIQNSESSVSVYGKAFLEQGYRTLTRRKVVQDFGLWQSTIAKVVSYIAKHNVHQLADADIASLDVEWLNVLEKTPDEVLSMRCDKTHGESSADDGIDRFRTLHMVDVQRTARPRAFKAQEEEDASEEDLEESEDDDAGYGDSADPPNPPVSTSSQPGKEPMPPLQSARQIAIDQSIEQSIDESLESMDFSVDATNATLKRLRAKVGRHGRGKGPKGRKTREGGG